MPCVRVCVFMCMQTELRERWQKTAECVRSLQRELNHWARKPHSAEFYRRYTHTHTP